MIMLQGYSTVSVGASPLKTSPILLDFDEANIEPAFRVQIDIAVLLGRILDIMPRRQNATVNVRQERGPSSTHSSST